MYTYMYTRQCTRPCSSHCLARFRVEVRGPTGTINGAYGELTGPRRGRIVDDDDTTGTYNTGSGFDTITAELPVRLSFGLADGLRGITSGKAFMTTAFGGWQRVPGAPDATPEVWDCHRGRSWHVCTYFALSHAVDS